MKAMPHRDGKFKKVPDNIAYYDVVMCNTTAIEARPPDKRVCYLDDLVIQNEFINRVIDAAQQGKMKPNPDSKTDPSHYIQSIGVWFWMGIGFACATGVFSILFIFLRYCLFCVKGGSCGKRYPTVVHYSKFKKRFTLILYIGFCATIIVLVILGLVRGSESIGPALKAAVVDGPRKTMDVLKSVSEPLRQFTLDASRVMVASITAMNTTIYRAVNIAQVHSDVTCVRAFAQGPAPLDADSAITDISNMQRHMGALPQGLTQGLSRLSRDIARLRSDLPQLRTALTSIQEAVPKVIPTTRDLIGWLSQLEQVVAGLTPYPTRIRNNFLDLLSGLPSDTELIGADGNGGLRNDLNQLGNRGCAACPDGKDYRAGLVRSMRETVADMGDIPSITGIADDIDALRALGLEDLKILDKVMDAIRACRDAVLSMPNIPTLTASLRAVADVVASFDSRTYNDLLIQYNQAGINVPNYDGLRAQLSASQALRDGPLACMQRLTLAAAVVNGSLVLLPPEVDAVVRNFTLSVAQFSNIPNLQNISDAFGAYKTTLRALGADINPYVSQVVTLEAPILATRSDTSLTLLANRMATLDVERPPLDLSSTLQYTYQLRATLDESLPRISTVQALRDVGVQVKALSSALTTAANRVEALQGAPEQQSAVLPAIDAIDNMVTAMSGLDTQLSVNMELLADGALANLANVGSVTLAAQNASASANALLDLSAYRRNIDALRAALPVANAPNFTLLVTNWTAVQNVVASLPDLDTVKVQLRAIEDNYGYYLPLGDVFELAERHINRSYALMVTTGPGILDTVREAKIKQILDEDPNAGVRTAMEKMLQAVEDFYAIMEPSPDKPLGLLDNEFVQESLTRVSILTDEHKYSELGGLYFIGSLVKEDLFFDGGDRRYLPWEDLDGKHYEISQGPDRPLKRLYCLTDYCLKKAVALFDDEPLSELFKRVFDSNSFSLMGLSRRQAFYVAYTFPLIVMVFALLGIAFGSRIALSWAMWIILLATPIIFLTAGALQWPSFLFVADGCRSSENLVSKALHMVYDSRHYMLRGRPLDINLADLYDNVVSSCPLTGAGGSNELDVVYNSVINEFDNYSREELDKWLATFEPSEEGTPGPNVTATARSAAANMDRILVSLIRNVSKQVTCDELHDSYYDLKNSICCDAMEPFYWVFATWYLLAFSFCLCGMPASIWGRKRLVPPYGPLAEEAVPLDDETLARFYLSPKRPIRKRSWMTILSFGRSSRRRPKTPTWNELTPSALSPHEPHDPHANVAYMGVEASPRDGRTSPGGGLRVPSPPRSPRAQGSPSGSSKGKKKNKKALLGRASTGPIDGLQGYGSGGDISDGRENVPLSSSLPPRLPGGLRKESRLLVERTHSEQLSLYHNGDGSGSSAAASPQAKVRGRYAQVGEAFLPPPPSLEYAAGGGNRQRSLSPSPATTPPRTSRSSSRSPTRENASLTPPDMHHQAQQQAAHHQRKSSRGSPRAEREHRMAIWTDMTPAEHDAGPESPPLDHHLRQIFDGENDGRPHQGGGFYPDVPQVDSGNAAPHQGLQPEAKGGWKFSMPLPPVAVDRDVAAAGRSPRTPEAAPQHMSPLGAGQRTRSHPIMADGRSDGSPLQPAHAADMSPSAPPLVYAAEEETSGSGSAQFASFVFDAGNSSGHDSELQSFEFSLDGPK